MSACKLLCTLKMFLSEVQHRFLQRSRVRSPFDLVSHKKIVGLLGPFGSHLKRGERWTLKYREKGRAPVGIKMYNDIFLLTFSPFPTNSNLLTVCRFGPICKDKIQSHLWHLLSGSYFSLQTRRKKIGHGSYSFGVFHRGEQNVCSPVETKDLNLYKQSSL